MTDSRWDGVLIRLTEPRGYAAFVSLFLGAAYLIQATLYTGMRPDDAEFLLFGQSLQAGYAPRNPPLFAWIISFSEQLFGPNAQVVRGLRLAFVGIGLCLYASIARRLISDRRLAALAALSPMLIFFLAYVALVNFTHTAMLVAAVPALFCALLYLEKRRSILAHILFGALLGAGFLSKYSFLLVAASMLLAALTIREFRAALLDPRSILALAVAAVIATPNLLWLLEHLGGAQEQVAQSLRTGSLGSDPIWARAQGAASVIDALFDFHLPWLLIFLLLLAPSLRKKRSADWQREEGKELWLRLLSRHLLLLAVLTFASVALTGATRVHTHYFFMFFLAPIWALSLLEGRPVGNAPRRFYGLLAPLLAVAALVGTLVNVFIEPMKCNRKCFSIMPYDELAAAIGADGFSEGTIISYSGGIALPGENLRHHFPAARLVSAKGEGYEPPERMSAGACLVVFAPAADEALEARLRSEAVWPLKVPVPEEAVTRTPKLKLSYSEREALAISYILIEKGLGDCN